MPTVVGSDNVSPNMDAGGLWKIWSIYEVWLGEEGTGKWVPKVLDWVADPIDLVMYIVDHLDPDTFVPTLRAFNLTAVGEGNTANDQLFNVLVPAQLDTYRAFLNTSVYPNTMALDQRFMLKGSQASYIKLFFGTDVSDATGEVLSRIYDASGNFISTNVPLTKVALDSHTNYEVWVPKRFHVTRQLALGERVTAVGYAADGQVLELRSFLVAVTDTFQDTSTPTKYITDIGLECMWLSASVADQIEYPLNIPMDALNMVGVVYYSDSPPLRLPVNGDKFTMLGIENRLSSIPGQPIDLVLRYALGPNEYAYSEAGASGNYVVKPYTLVTTNPNNSIACKLFGYPVWMGEALGYDLKWYLLNLDRNVYYDVSDKVTFSSSTGPYNPKQYGYLQRKQVRINLRDVSPSFVPFIHTQLVDIYLTQAPSGDNQASWSVNTEASDQYPRFGVGVYGKLVAGGHINFSDSFSTFDDWLDAYYWKTRPLFDVSRETRAPTPTHFIVKVLGITSEWPIASWDQDLSLAVGITAGQSIVIRFIRRTVSGDLSLTYASVIVKSF